MADTVQFELVSPERRLLSVAASAVELPAMQGDMTAMPDHEPTITSLRPGVLNVTGPEGNNRYLVTGGFAEISPESMSVLAERAIHSRDLTAELMEEYLAEARSAAEAATGDHADAARKRLDDLEAARVQLGA